MITPFTKVNAGAHIDELAQISKADRKIKADVDARHVDFASEGWQYRTAYFQDFDGKYYQLSISVARGPDGNVVYNIGRIERRNFPTISGSSAKGGALKSEKVSSETNIAQDGGDVNPEYSLRDMTGAAEDIPEDPAELCQQLLMKAVEAKNREALEVCYRKYVGDPSGRGAKSEDIAAVRAMERVYREAMGLGQYDEETVRELNGSMSGIWGIQRGTRMPRVWK